MSSGRHTLIGRALVFAGALLLLSLPRAVADEGRWTNQIASLSSESEAEGQLNQLRARGVDAYWIRSTVPGVGIRYRVRCGRFASKAEAQLHGEQLRGQGAVREFFVAEYEAPTDSAIADRDRQAEATTHGAPAGLPAPTSASTRDESAAGPTVTHALARAAAPRSDPDFLTFEDKDIGYSFQHPSHWSGDVWNDPERLSQVGGGASFRSTEDRAFLNAIWNKLPGANDPQKYDNTKLVDAIVKHVATGADVTELSAGSRRVESRNHAITTYVDMTARFRDPATKSTTEQFFGTAVISRCERGILLVVVFYSQDAPPSSVSNVERIVRSVRAPS